MKCWNKILFIINLLRLFKRGERDDDEFHNEFWLRRSLNEFYSWRCGSSECEVVVWKSLEILKLEV
jgi:hypothetical protein